MMKPTETHGCGDATEISLSKTQNHCEKREQVASATQTEVSTECEQTANGNEESENRNQSLTSTASPLLPVWFDPQNSPRIGALPPRPTPASSTPDSLLSTARRYLQRARVDWCTPFNRTSRQYLGRCSVPFEWNDKWHTVVFFQLSEREFQVDVRDQKNGELRASCRANVVIELVDAPAHA